MQRFTELKVWERSHALVLAVYRLSSGFPGTERHGLTDQIRRAAVSVPSNIAEGAKRSTRRDYAHFLNIAEGSLAETQYLLMLARDLGLAAAQDVEPHLAEAEEVLRMLAVLRRKVEKAA